MARGKGGRGLRKSAHHRATARWRRHRQSHEREYVNWQGRPLPFFIQNATRASRTAYLHSVECGLCRFRAEEPKWLTRADIGL